LLAIFGSSYTDATGLLELLAWGYFPNVVRAVYVTVKRVHRREGQAAVLLTIAGAVEIAAGAMGIQSDGLDGLARLLLLAFIAEALFMLPTVVRAARRERTVTP
jgi:O-antigen/teichoic acid export membrane protein